MFADKFDRAPAGRLQLTTDGWPSYRTAIPETFGDRVEFMTLVKTYGIEGVTEQRRYSPPVVTGIKLQDDNGKPRTGCRVHVTHRAEQSQPADVNATFHAVDERLLEEVGESSSRTGAVVRVLQLRTSSHDAEERNASDGQRACRSRLDDPRVDRRIGEVLIL